MKIFLFFIVSISSLFAEVKMTVINDIPQFSGLFDLTSLFTVVGIIVTVLSIVQSIKIALGAFGLSVGGRYSSRRNGFNARY